MRELAHYYTSTAVHRAVGISYKVLNDWTVRRTGGVGSGYQYLYTEADAITYGIVKALRDRQVDLDTAIAAADPDTQGLLVLEEEDPLGDRRVRINVDAVRVHVRDQLRKAQPVVVDRLAEEPHRRPRLHAVS